MIYKGDKCVDCDDDVFSVSGLCRRCKVCMDRRKKESSARSREKRKGIPKSPKQRYVEYGNGAINRNYAFELTEEQFMTFWDKPCHYCKLPINGIGIDRVDNSIGYVMSNCVPCCTVCNMMKFKQSYKHFIAKCVQIAKAHSTE